jgi:hypothetical protein
LQIRSKATAVKFEASVFIHATLFNINKHTSEIIAPTTGDVLSSNHKIMPYLASIIIFITS